MRTSAALLLAVVVSACGMQGADADAVMCDVLAQLEAAYEVAEEASHAESAGEEAEAEALAADASNRAEEAKNLLDTITDEAVRSDAGWEVLLAGYLHIAQGANALLPEYANTQDMARDELRLASRRLVSARAVLDHCEAQATPQPGG